MPGKTQSHTDAVLNVLRGVAVAGVTPYAGLFSTAPADDNSAGTELAGNGYARQAAAFGAPITDTGNLRKISNANNIQFGPALADWPQAVGFGVFGAQSAGNLLYWDVLPTPKTIQQGDFGQFAPGSLVVEED
jgi:hypothetical protein